MRESNLVPRVLLGTKVSWWIVVTWFRLIAQILGSKTIYFEEFRQYNIPTNMFIL